MSMVRAGLIAAAGSLTVAYKAQVVAATSPATSSSFTPTANAKIYVFATIRRNGSLPNAATITDNLGSPLTYTNLFSVPHSPALDPYQLLMCWEAQAGASPVAMTVQVTSASANAVLITIIEVLGAATPTNFGNATSITGSPTLTLATAPASTSLVATFLHVQGTVAIDPPTGMLELQETAGGTARQEIATTFAANQSYAYSSAGNVNSVGAIMEITR